MRKRCSWADGDPLYEKYHDKEWGVPLYNDKKIFEFLILESMQAGLSWITILRKRENFRKAFAGFDFEKVARFNQRSVERLMQDSGIIRNRKKIEAAIANAKAFIRIRKEFGTFSKYIWGFVDGKPVDSKCKTMGDIPAMTETAKVISKDLKKRGFKFLGPTTVYAHMQAAGMVNDHLVSCFRYKEVKKLAKTVK